MLEPTPVQPRAAAKGKAPSLTDNPNPDSNMTPVDDPVAAATACQNLALEREGIPVVLALDDLRGTAPEVSEDAARADGVALAALARAYSERFFVNTTDDDAEALYTTLSVIGHCHIREAV